MEPLGKARLIRRTGAAAHFIGILAGASALYNLWFELGRYISHKAPIGWGMMLYRLVLCALFVGGGLGLGRLADRLAADGDAERAAAAQAERDEADRLTRQISVPRRRNRSS